MGEPRISEKAFKEAVAEATVLAEERVARVHRRRLVAWAAAIAFVAATLVNIPVSAVVSHNNSRVNCVAITELAGLGKERGARERDKLNAAKAKVQAERARTARFRHESPSRLGLPPKSFDRLIAEQEQEQAATLTAVVDEQAEQRHRQVVTERIAAHNCG